MQIYILSGVPGSGKSTTAQRVIAEASEHPTERKAVVCSADDFFMKDGVYKFDASQIGAAHAQCLRDYTSYLWQWYEGLGNPPNIVIVDNTNISPEEIAPYYALAKAFDCDVSIYTVMCDPDIAFKRNVHGVPERTIRSMHDRLKNRKLPHYWIENKEWPVGNSGIKSKIDLPR